MDNNSFPYSGSSRENGKIVKYTMKCALELENPVYAENSETYNLHLFFITLVTIVTTSLTPSF